MNRVLPWRDICLPSCRQVEHVRSSFSPSLPPTSRSSVLGNAGPTAPAAPETSTSSRLHAAHIGSPVRRADRVGVTLIRSRCHG